MTTRTILAGTLNIIMQSDLNTLANGAAVISAATENTVMTGGVVTPTNSNYPNAEFEHVSSSTAAATAQTTVLYWFLRAIDGSTYEEGSSSVIPTRDPDLVFIMEALTSQRVTKQAKMPVGPFKVLCQNNSGQAFLSANKLSCKPFTDAFN